MPVHRIKADIPYKMVQEVRKIWRNEEEMRMNIVEIETGYGIVRIKPICYKGMGCQGAITVHLKNGKKLQAELKRGAIIWFLGDIVRENNIPEFIGWCNIVLSLTELIKPVVDVLPTEYYIHRTWDVEITLFSPNYGLPEYARNKPHNNISLRIPKLT